MKPGPKAGKAPKGRTVVRFDRETIRALDAFRADRPKLSRAGLVRLLVAEGLARAGGAP